MTAILTILIIAIITGVAFVTRELRSRNVQIWLGSYLRQDWREPVPPGVTRHLMLSFVDHFEPGFERPSFDVEQARVARWSHDYPLLCENHRDADGRPPIHTFFYPEEEYHPAHLDALVELCRMGLGEIEVHLHHDADTEAGLRAKLQRFTRQLIDRHDALPVDPDTGQARWGFIHGNWALDNARPDGRWCGVNNELVVLREEGCYADFTLPAAPDASQTRTINSIYYAKDDCDHPRSHETGEPVRVGGAPVGDLMIIQGPLGFMWQSRKFGVLPRIENADVRTTSPPTRARIDSWVDTAVHVRGRPEWTFVKIHTHGAPERDVEMLLGQAMSDAFTYLETRYNDGKGWKLHYVAAREMYNIVKAAEAGFDGDPGQYRDFAIPRPRYRPVSAATDVPRA